MSFPSLETLCVSAATESTHWKLQRRYLERLPEHAANELLALLLVRQPSELRPATLELFRHCVTRLELRPPPGGAAVAGGGGGGGGAGVAGQAVAAAITFGPDWAAALAGFNHLVELRMSGCSRLTVAALQALLLPAPATAKTRASAAAAADNAAATAGAWQLQPPCRSPAAASLRRLDVSGCAKLGDEAAALMARCCDGGGCSRSQDGVGAWGPGLGGGVTAVAAGLVSLDISETSVTGAGLRHLSALTDLTELRAGGLKSCSDADWCALLPHLPALRRLDAWGTDAGDGGDGGEQLLAVLATTGAAAAAVDDDGGSSTVISTGGGGCGSSSMGMHRLEQLSLAWTRMRVAPAFPALQVLDLRHCQLEDVWWPCGSGGAAPLPLRQLLLRGAVVSGRAAAAESGIAALVRHAAATLELLDLADVSAPTAAVTVTSAGGGGGAVWPLPLAALAGRRVDGSDSSGGGCGGGGGHGGGGAPRLTHLDISRTAVPAEQLEELQHAPALAKLVAAGCRGAGSARGAAALVSAGLRQLRELDLSAAGVGDDCVSWLQQLSSLTSLNLSGNTALSLAPPPPPPPLQPLQPPAQEQGQQQQQQQQQQQHQDAEAEEEERVDAMANVWRRDERPAAAREEAGSSSRRSSSSSSGEGEDGCSSNGSSHVWPQLLRLNLLGTRVTEAGLRALLSALVGNGGRGRGPRGGDGGSGGSGGGDVSRPPAASALEQLKLGGGGFTDGAAAVLAAARLPRLHSLLVRDAPLSGHGALLLAASGGGGGGGLGGGGGGGGLTALRRLELQACWLVSPQDAARMADCMAATASAAAAGTAAAGPQVLVVVNGKAAGAAAAAAPAGLTGLLVAARSGAASSHIATPAGRKAVAAAAAAAAARAGAVASAAAVAAAAGDLSAYDQRLRYNRQELITVLAAAPLAGGGGGAAAGCSWPEELGDAPASATALWGRQPAVGAAAAGTAASAGKAAAQTAAAVRAAVVAVLPADLLRPVGAA